jgi:outer membrane protein insertion porin family
VAARADRHYLIAKDTLEKGKRVATRVTELASERRREEIARMLAGAEIIFPMPFVKDGRSMRPVLFIDSGNVFNSKCPKVSTVCDEIDLNLLRYSVGFSLTWITGMGPMTFGIAKAFNYSDSDETEFFQFELGRTF